MYKDIYVDIHSISNKNYKSDTWCSRLLEIRETHYSVTKGSAFLLFF